MTISTTDPCPCRSGDTYGDCCGRFHVGLASWHPSTRPEALDLVDDVVWRGLEIVRTERGGPLDTTGVVEFVARYRENGQDSRGGRPPVEELHEVSRFVREDARWFYVAGAHPA